MAEYIEREAAYRFAQDQMKKETGAYSKGWNNALNVMKSAFHNNDAIPAADVVPVVRCRECKHLGDNDGYYFCNAIGIAFGNKPNWFCADGERREVQDDN